MESSKHKIVWSLVAIADMDAIWDYYENRREYDHLSRLHSAILDEVNGIVFMPYKHPKEHSRNHPDIRFTTCSHYKILFHIHKDIIEILRIFHMARNPLTL